MILLPMPSWAAAFIRIDFQYSPLFSLISCLFGFFAELHFPQLKMRTIIFDEA